MTLSTTFGGLLAASWIAAALSGVVLLQTYLYYRSRPSQDSLFFGVLVASLAVLDLAHIACVVVACYHYLVQSFGNSERLLILTPPLALTVGLTALITFIVQCFFALRVWKMSWGNWLPTGLIVLVSAARLGCGWTTTIRAIHYGTFQAFVDHLRWIFTIGVALSVVADVLITGSLCYWLNSSRSGLKKMDAVVDKIILYTIETGALTSAVSVISLICVSAMPRNLIFIAVHFVISKLYINTLLASLNTRNALRNHGTLDERAVSKLRFSAFTAPSSSKPDTERREDFVPMQYPQSKAYNAPYPMDPLPGSKFAMDADV